MKLLAYFPHLEPNLDAFKAFGQIRFLKTGMTTGHLMMPRLENEIGMITGTTLPAGFACAPLALSELLLICP